MDYHPTPFFFDKASTVNSNVFETPTRVTPMYDMNYEFLIGRGTYSAVLPKDNSTSFEGLAS